MGQISASMFEIRSFFYAFFCCLLQAWLLPWWKLIIGKKMDVFWYPSGLILVGSAYVHLFITSFPTTFCRIIVPSRAPINFKVTTVSSTSILASWELAPEDSRSGRITGFKLFYKKKGSGDSANILIINSGSKLATNVTELDIFTEYEFQVLAFTSDDDGPKSSLKFNRTNEDGKGLATE